LTAFGTLRRANPQMSPAAVSPSRGGVSRCIGRFVGNALAHDDRWRTVPTMEGGPGPFDSRLSTSTTWLEERSSRLGLLLVLAILIGLIVAAQSVQPALDPSIPVETPHPSLATAG
jgi:hypothetical protein